MSAYIKIDNKRLNPNRLDPNSVRNYDNRDRMQSGICSMVCSVDPVAPRKVSGNDIRCFEYSPLPTNEI